MKYAAIAITLLSTLSVSLADGIKCDLSVMCKFPTGGDSQDPDTKVMKDLIDQIPDDKHFGDGEYLACQNVGRVTLANDAYCTFAQGGDGVTGFDAKWAIQAIIDHNCSKCGQVPVGSESVLDGDNMFKFDYVSDRRGCDRVC